MSKLRLNKILAQAGLSSRRGADRLIAEGHVSVNGVVTRDLATLADPDVDIVALRGVPLPHAERKQYLLLHKPAGYVTTVSDPRGRPTVAELGRDVGARLYPVGRLDWDVEGVRDAILALRGKLPNRAGPPPPIPAGAAPQSRDSAQGDFEAK